MIRRAKHTYSRITRHAVMLLGKQIRNARMARKMTAGDLADRAGISRGLLQRIENGNLRCRIGSVFEVAILVGIKLFEADDITLVKRIRQVDDRIALLPKHTHTDKKVVDDDF